MNSAGTTLSWNCLAFGPGSRSRNSADISALVTPKPLICMGQAQFYPNCVAVPRGPGPGPSAPRGVRARIAFTSHWLAYLVAITGTFML